MDSCCHTRWWGNTTTCQFSAIACLAYMAVSCFLHTFISQTTDLLVLGVCADAKGLEGELVVFF